jgi:hypothetical protein
MLPWDALMHAFSIMGLGGFSTKDASLGHFDSLEIELVVIFFALLAGINFSTHFLALSKRSLRDYRFDVEAHYFLGFLAVSSACPGGLPVAGRGLRGFSDDVSLRGLSLRVAGHIAWLRDHRLRPVAVVRPVVDPVSSAALSPVPVRPAAASR